MPDAKPRELTPVEAMTADFIASTYVPINDNRYPTMNAYMALTIAEMRGKGAKFFRLSHPPTEPAHIWIEGWRSRPNDQGPHPWH